MENYAIIRVPVATVWDRTAHTRINDKGETVSAIADELLSGYVVRVLEEKDGMLRILSHYGYAGWVEPETLRVVTKAGALQWLESGLQVLTARCADVMSLPTVTAEHLSTLPRGALLRPIAAENGWTLVELGDESRGYVPTARLMKKRFGEEPLWEAAEPWLELQEHASEEAKTTPGGQPGFDLQALLEREFGGSEEAFRAELVMQAMSCLGMQYRWAGRSGFGIDCSGLVGMSYQLCGVSIYRDAKLVRGYPLQRLPLAWDGEGHFLQENLEGDRLLPGDALFFPGHVAMYLGNGRYIHSTARAGDNGVVINSLRPGDEGYREDLLQQLYACGGVRR